MLTVWTLLAALFMLGLASGGGHCNVSKAVSNYQTISEGFDVTGCASEDAPSHRNTEFVICRSLEHSSMSNLFKRVFRRREVEGNHAVKLSIGPNLARLNMFRK